MPNDSVFNTRIDTLPVDKESSTYLAHSSTLPISFGTAWGITYADSSTPIYSAKPYYGALDGTQPTYLTPFPDRQSLKRENGSFVGSQPTNNDAHSIIVEKDSCSFYELYNDRVSLSGTEFSETFLCQNGSSGCNLSSEATPYKSTTFAMPTTATDAAGLELAPLTWTLADIEAGPKHAVRFTTTAGSINGLEWPATTANVAGNTGAAPYGARFRLKTAANGGPDLATTCLSNGTVNQQCVNMLVGLQNYGMILADIGLGNNIIISSDATEDPKVREAITLIGNAHLLTNLSTFDVVDESSLQETSANGYQLASSGSYAVDPLNEYVTLSDYALITATPHTGSPVRLSIALQGVGIGLHSNSMSIAAGMSNYEIPTWVTPSAYSQALTWAIATTTCSGDSITSDGAYLPPTSGAPCRTTLTATSSADPNVKEQLYVSVVGNNSGTYSIDFNSLPAGSTSSSPNKVWSDDFGIEASDSNFYPYPDYPNWTSNGTLLPEYTQYGSYLYTYGGDIRYRIVLPNGNYKVRWMLGQPWNGSTGSTFPQRLAHVASFSVNGLLEAHLYDPDVAAEYHYATPADLVIPAKVINNVLETVQFGVAPDHGITAAQGLGAQYYSTADPVPFPSLCVMNGSYCIKSSQAEGLEIIPDNSAPHWVIDTQGVTKLNRGQCVQLYNVDWYTGVNDPEWTVLGTPLGASISTNGLVCLSSSVAPSSRTIVVRASDGAYSTSTMFTVVGGVPKVPAPTPSPVPSAGPSSSASEPPE